MHPVLIEFTPFDLRNHLMWMAPLFGLAWWLGKRWMKDGNRPLRRTRGWRLYSAGSFFAPVAFGILALLWIGTLGHLQGWLDPRRMTYPLKIHTYGLMMAMGFVVSISWSTREARRVGLDSSKVMDASMWLVVSGLIGAKGLYVLTRLPEYLAKPKALLKVFQAGFVWYGGLIGATLVGLHVFKKKGLPIWKTADVFAPAVMLGLGIGRIGCFAAGCCHGGVCATGSHWYTVTFHNPKSSVDDRMLGLPLFPTQPAETIVCFLIFGFLTWYARRKRYDGQITALMLLLYAIWRPLNEMMRGDSIRGFLLPGLSTSQFISVLMVGASVGLMAVLPKRGKIGKAAEAS